jgi:hypothetical protein
MPATKLGLLDSVGDLIHAGVRDGNHHDAMSTGRKLSAGDVRPKAWRDRSSSSPISAKESGIRNFRTRAQSPP